MDLQPLIDTLRRDALSVVFVNVLLQQIGLPVPVVPTLLLAGSLAAGPSSLGRLLAAAVLASVVADWLWYRAGRRFGYRVLGALCKLSINPASCVNQTEARFVRWGMASLLVAKFIPGFSTVAPPIAGAMRMTQTGFLLASAAGAALWAGAALGTGWLLQDAVQDVVVRIESQTGSLLTGVALLAAAWIGWKLWRKYRFEAMSRLPHISAAELLAAMGREPRPLLLDLRGATMIAETGPLPGARVAEHDRLHEAVADWPRDRLIVTLCACPEDAGAIQAARKLLDAGYRSVMPLAGGYDAWVAAGGSAWQPELRTC